jgi:hypothetical protein
MAVYNRKSPFFLRFSETFFTLSKKECKSKSLISQKKQRFSGISDFFLGFTAARISGNFIRQK